MKSTKNNEIEEKDRANTKEAKKTEDKAKHLGLTFFIEILS